ncbi:MAG: helix-turn-helix transcriptional regulator [Candidatus Pelagibacter ubique]
MGRAEKSEGCIMSFDDEKLLSSQEVAMLLGVPVERIYTWTHMRKLPYIRISRKMIRFRKSDVEKWLQERTIKEAK